MKKKYKSPYKSLKPETRFEYRISSGKKHVKVGGFYGKSYCEEEGPLSPACGVVAGLVVTSFLAFVGVAAYFTMLLW